VSDAAIANAPQVEPPSILPETHYAAARLFESQRLIGKAIVQYRKAVAVNHHYVDAYHRLGLLLSVSGRREEAVRAFRRAVELKPKNPIVRNNLGFELLLSNRLAAAERELTRAIKLKPGFARAYVNLGIVQSKQGRYDKGLASFRMVLPETDAYYNLGLIYRGQGRYSDAAESFRHVLSLDPNFEVARTRMAALTPHLEGEIHAAPMSPTPKDVMTTADSEPQPRGPVTTSATGAAETGKPTLEPSFDPNVQAEQTTWEEAFALLDDIMTTTTVVDGDYSVETDERTYSQQTDVDIPAFPSDLFGPYLDTAVTLEPRTPEEPCDEVLLVDIDAAANAGAAPTHDDAFTFADIDEILELIDPFQTESQINPFQISEEEPVLVASWDGMASMSDAAFVEVSDMLEVSDPVEPVSYVDFDAATSTPEPVASEMYVAGAASIEQEVLALTSSTDSWALMLELEDRLALVRNDIQCLESREADVVRITVGSEPGALERMIAHPPLIATGTTRFMGPPAELAGIRRVETSTVRPANQTDEPRAKLVVDVVEDESTGSAGSKARPASTRKTVPTDTRKPRKQNERKRSNLEKPDMPTRRSSNWQSTFERLEGLLATAFNDFNCEPAPNFQETVFGEPFEPDRRDSSVTQPHFSLEPDAHPLEAGRPVYGVGVTVDDGEWQSSTLLYPTADHARINDAQAGMPAPPKEYFGLRGAYGHETAPLPD
jgi:tetratricopeptide (TPR) repeat protein